MKRNNLLIIASAICLLFAEVTNAESKSESSKLIKLRKEYREQAKREISPINDRYLVKLKRLEKLYLQAAETNKTIAVRREIELVEGNPAHLFDYVAKSIPISDFSGEWVVKYSAGGSSQRVLFESDGKVTFLDSVASVVMGAQSKLQFDEEREVYFAQIGENFRDEYSLSDEKLIVWRWSYSSGRKSWMTAGVGERKVKVRDAQVVSDLEFVPIQIGENAFPITNFRWVSVPKSLDSFFASKEKVEFLNFTVRKGGMVRILSGWAEREYLKNRGWKLIGLAQLANDSGKKRTWYFFERRLSEGNFSLKSVSWIGTRLVLPDIPQE